MSLTPITRVEQYLNALTGETQTSPDFPAESRTRVETFLADIITEYQRIVYLLQHLPKAMVYKGVVDYYSSLPTTDLHIGDVYTVRYKGTSGTVADGTEYVLATLSPIEWIPLSEKILTNTSTQGNVTVAYPDGSTSGYSGTQYRLLSGLYDGQGNHDAATVGQLGIVSQSVTLLSESKADKALTGTAAPTTATVGKVGQLYLDTTNSNAYVCFGGDENTGYTWKEVILG